MGYSPQGHKESDIAKQPSTHTYNKYCFRRQEQKESEVAHAHGAYILAWGERKYQYIIVQKVTVAVREK